MTLTRFDRDGLELVINTRTGEAYASIRGYARMSGKAESTIRKRLQGAHLPALEMAEIHTPGGLQGAHLIPEDLISEWIVTDNLELAKAMLRERAYPQFDVPECSEGAIIRC